MFNGGLLALVQVNFEEPGTVQTDPGSLSDDFSWVNKIVQYGVVHGSQGPAHRSLLLQLVGLASRLG